MSPWTLRHSRALPASVVKYCGDGVYAHPQTYEACMVDAGRLLAAKTWYQSSGVASRTLDVVLRIPRATDARRRGGITEEHPVGGMP